MQVNRDAISRARFFLQKAQECLFNQRNEFEAYLDASIIFTRAALLRIETKYKKHPKFKNWWADLLSNQTSEFVRNERNLILHEAPAKIGQVIRVNQSSKYAYEFYYYENHTISATDTIKKHIDEMEKIVLAANSIFKV